jgi:hypothetical protein
MMATMITKTKRVETTAIKAIAHDGTELLESIYSNFDVIIDKNQRYYDYSC